MVPFGGGTSVVGGSSRSREHRRSSRSTSPACAPWRWTALARPPGWARAAGPRCRAAARRARRHARPLPAVLRAGDHRRLRRDPLGRPGLQRLRALRRAGHRRRADRPRGRPADAADTAHRRRAFAARARPRLRGRARRDHRRQVPGPPEPEARRYEGWIAPDFAAGREIVRALAQSHEMPDVLRLSDEEETRVSLELSGRRACRRALDAYLALRRRQGGCLLICGWEGERESGPSPPLAGRAPAALGRGRPARTGRRALLGEGPLRGALPARRAAGHGRLRRDAGDRPHLEPPRRALPRRQRRAAGRPRARSRS